jgi:N utilization substance protein B
MGVRRKSRELVLQALFQSEFLDKPALAQLELLVENFQVNRKALPYAKEILTGISSEIAQIDKTINKHAENWRLERMSAVDRNILRIAANELLFRDDVPPTVSINEAIEITKKFSTSESAAFINGILDAIRQSKIITNDEQKK